MQSNKIYSYIYYYILYYILYIIILYIFLFITEYIVVLTLAYRNYIYNMLRCMHISLKKLMVHDILKSK